MHSVHEPINLPADAAPESAMPRYPTCCCIAAKRRYVPGAEVASDGQGKRRACLVISDSRRWKGWSAVRASDPPVVYAAQSITASIKV
jgi:hypothetical protein